MEQPEGFVYDIEADNFYLQSKNMWYIYFKSLDGTKELEVYPFRETVQESRDKILKYINQFEDGCIVSGHNINGYDNWMLWRHLGISFSVGNKGKDYFFDKEVTIIDTLTLSMFYNTDIPSHSLGAWGERLGNKKIDFHDFSCYTEEMRLYCKQDVDVNIQLFKHLWKKVNEQYVDWIHPSFKLMQKDHYLYSAQAFTGVSFDKELAERSVIEIQGSMEDIETNVLPTLPPRSLKKGEEKFYTMPAKPFKKNGEISSTMIKWIEKHNGVVEGDSVIVYGKSEPIIANRLLDKKLPMEMKDNKEIKEWFISEGWKPIYWNSKKDEKGKPLRDKKGNIEVTTPKIQEMGNICPNLLELQGELPSKIVKYLSLRNRKSILEGWLSNWRLPLDGRLSATISGYTPTCRVKHSVVVNVPKASPKVLYGEVFRSLFKTENDRKYVGVDASALENRTLANYTLKYDNGVFADLVLNGDCHTFNAKFAFFEEELKNCDIYAEDFDKDSHDFKPYRDKSKTGQYLLAYGGSAKKLAQSLGFSESKAKTIYDKYWIVNAGLGLLKDKMEKYWEGAGKKKYIPAINNKLLSIRSKNVLINVAGQSAGAIIMATSFCLMDNWLGDLKLDELGRPYYLYKGHYAARVSAFHDESSWECDPEIAEDIKNLAEKAIVKSGEYYKMGLEIAAEGKVGDNWRDVH